MSIDKNQPSALPMDTGGNNINYMLAAAVVGTPIAIFQDLMDYEEEPWALTVQEFLRYALIKGVEPSTLLPSDASRLGATPLTGAPRESVSHTLRAHIRDFEIMATEIGWEEGAMRNWLTDDFHFGQMNMTALDDLCSYLRFDLGTVVTLAWESLGKTA